MKRYYFILAVLLLAVSAVAQDFNMTDLKGRRQGKWRDFYPNGQLRYEGAFRDDRCKGTFRYYDEQGNLKATNEFDKSGEKALNKTYAPNGRVIATGYYVNRKKEGEWKYYDANSGQLRLVEDNKNGKVHGWSRIYNPENGVLAEKTQFVEGQPEGQCEKYSYTGTLIMECQYHNGLLDGPARIYYPSTASLKEEGQYTKGKKSGVWKTYNEEGDIIAEEAFGDFVY